MSKPWEMAKEIPAQDQATEMAQPRGILPWLMQRQDFVPPAAPTNKSPDMFDRVFANMVQAESGGKHTNNGALLTSPAGAKGVTQVMPATGIDPGFGVKPLQNQSEEEYRRFGGDYLKAMLTHFNGDYEKALAAYNAGAGSVRNAITKATNAGNAGDWMNHLPKKSETIPYVRKIMRGLQ